MNILRKYYGTGFGNLHTSQRNIPAAAPGPPGPPFLPTSANSGLWVDPITGVIQLDGSGGANPLLQNTFIQTPPFVYGVGDMLLFGNGFGLTIDDFNSLIVLGNQAGGAGVLRIQSDTMFYAIGGGVHQFLNIDPTGTLSYKFGDINNSNSGSYFKIDDANLIFQMISVGGAETFFEINVGGGNRQFSFGDVAKFNLDSRIVIDDVLQDFRFYSNNTGVYLDLNAQTGLYQIGDLTPTANGSQFLIDDTVKTFQMVTNTGTSLLFDENVKRYQVGDVANTGNGHILDINDATQVVDLGDSVGILLRLDNSVTPSVLTYFVAVGQRGLLIDGNAQLYGMGDVDAVAGGTAIQINDATAQMNLKAANGVGINSVPTLSPFAVSGLQPFANNAAAVAGGLGVGDFYRISVAGTSAVAVVQ